MVTRTDGPFEYYNEIHAGATGDSIRAAATAPEQNANALQAFADELGKDGARVESEIEGDIKNGTAANAQQVQSNGYSLAAKGKYAAGLLKQFAEYVDTFDTTTNDLNVQVHSQAASAARYAGQAAAYEHKDFDSVAYTKQAEKNMENFLRPQYNKALHTLDTDADSIATKFKQGPTDANVKDLIRSGLIDIGSASLYPGLTLSDDDKASYYQHILAGKTPEQRAQYILEHKEISGAVIDKLTKDDPQTAAAIAKVVSDKIRDFDYDDDDVSDLTDMINRFKDSHQVSAAVLKDLGGKDLVHAINQAAGGLYMGHDGDKGLATAIRDMFRSGEPTLAQQDPEASRQLARDMVQEMRDDPRHGEISGNDPLAVSYLLKDSTLSTPFLDTMGDELEHMERDSPNSSFTWRGFSSMQHGGSWLFDEGDRDAAFDPMASYMSALGHNDEASLQFFDGGGENPYGHDAQDRQDYWIKDRYWGHDDFDGLMSALDSATTGHDNLSDPTSAKNAADLMSHTVDLLAQRHGVDFGVDGENFNPGDVSSDGTKHVAHMLSTYMASVDQALDDKNPADIPPGTQTLTDPRFGGMTNMPVFSAQELRNLTDVAVSTDDGFNAMRHGVSTYENIQMANSIQQHGRIDDPTSQADARLEGFFVNSVGDTKIADAADKDARVQSWIDMGKDIVGEVPVPGGQVVEFLASHAIDEGASQLSDHYANNEGHEVDSENDYAVAALEARHQAAQQALVNAGVISPTEVYQTLHGSGATYTQSQVDSWFPGGKFPSQEQYDAMPPDQQKDVRNALATIVEGHHLNDTTNYDQTYKDMFSDYFEKGDGDGN